MDMKLHLGAWIVGTALFAGGCFYDVTVGRCDKDGASGGDACKTSVSGDSSAGSGDSPAGSEGGHDQVAPIKHAACMSELPTVLPDVPSVDVTPAGRPNFDLWRDLDCSMINDVTLCDSTTICDTSGKYGLCIQFGSQGICGIDDDTMCDGGEYVVGSQDGKCQGCASIAQHAGACCLGLQGFDCRAWPYPSDGKPGMVCARHEDCEPGLLCGAGEGEGFGICQCPGLNSPPILGSIQCFTE
jgi:hypothetical protein